MEEGLTPLLNTFHIEYPSKERGRIIFEGASPLQSTLKQPSLPLFIGYAKINSRTAIFPPQGRWRGTAPRNYNFSQGEVAERKF